MIPWWVLIPVVLVSLLAGMWFTGRRWQRAWLEREKRTRKTPDPYRKAEQ